MEQTLEIKTRSDPRLLSVIRAATGQIALVSGFESKQTEQIKLAVDEICTNIIRHTYDGDITQEIVIQFTLDEEDLEVQIQDFGDKVDPRIWKRPRHGTAAPGGLGLSLVRSSVDMVEFGLPTPVGNMVRLVKHKKRREA